MLLAFPTLIPKGLTSVPLPSSCLPPPGLEKTYIIIQAQASTGTFLRLWPLSEITSVFHGVVRDFFPPKLKRPENIGKDDFLWTLVCQQPRSILKKQNLLLALSPLKPLPVLPYPLKLDI